ncbi:MAG: hypothetical protein C6H99_07145 [Epsilonproteobacteria bacterium]|nr:hypothetical protein [Campylobacterota bacterium]NPA63698.1 hypothetical protein [Campylobacterota bacterium]
MKKGALLLLSQLLLWSTPHSYTDRLKAYMALKKEFELRGYFYYYDFDKDGYDYNDWIYKDLRSGKLFRLLAIKPSSDNVFGFAPVAPKDLPSKPKGYFVFLAMPQEDVRFSWVYIDATTLRPYKLLGSTKEGYMRYLDLNGDGKPDPLDLGVTLQEDRVQFDPDLRITDISCGWYHTCYIQEGVGYCFGDNAYGELGDGTTKGGPRIKRVKLLDNLIQIEASKEYTCALTQGGEAFCWGRNEYGKLGNSAVDKSQYPLNAIPASFIPFDHQPYATLPQRVTKEPVGTLKGLKSISAGSWHACGVDEKYTYCWGQNFDGALGIGKDPKNFMSFGAFDIAQNSLNLQFLFWPRALKVHKSTTSTLPLTSATSVSAGSSDHTCVLTKEKRVRCWGWNSAVGEVGTGDTQTEYYTAPAPEVITYKKEPLSGVLKIVTGSDHTCALRQDHTVWCWGNNENGELGDGLYEPKPFASPVKTQSGAILSNIYEIFSDRASHTCGIDHFGLLYCWGSNAQGELGIGKEIPNIPYAVQIPLPEPVLFGSAGGGGISPFDPQIVPHRGEHTCVVSVGDHIYCWGNNDYGQLGTKDFRNRYYPTQIK